MKTEDAARLDLDGYPGDQTSKPVCVFSTGALAATIFEMRRRMWDTIWIKTRLRGLQDTWPSLVLTCVPDLHYWNDVHLARWIRLLAVALVAPAVVVVAVVVEQKTGCYFRLKTDRIVDRMKRNRCSRMVYRLTFCFPPAAITTLTAYWVQYRYYQPLKPISQKVENTGENEYGLIWMRGLASFSHLTDSSSYLIIEYVSTKMP
jgi:hypothetical protein